MSSIFVLYDWLDSRPVVLSICSTPLQAIETLASYGYGKIAGVDSGADWGLSVRQWEEAHQ